jgi:arginine N-succinyltransferase
MSFIVRPVEKKDLEDLFQLTSQFTLLNLPADRSVLTGYIERSEKSFQKKLSKEDGATYIFVIEDTEARKIIASSMILAKHGTKEMPHYSFKIIRKDHFSQDIGIGFIHQVLRFTEDSDGPTEIGGLLLDKAYRKRPEKLGRFISLIRFMYMGMYPDDFEKRVLCELSPPLTPEGRSEFWEALGRRFTGLPYVEADLISQTNKEFIKTLFPPEDLYLALLDAKARIDIGRVGDATLPAKHLLESMGFHYLHEVDPFDGGPHYGARREDIRVVRDMQEYKVSEKNPTSFAKQGMLSLDGDQGFRGALVSFDIVEGTIVLPKWARDILSLNVGQKVYIYPFT